MKLLINKAAFLPAVEFCASIAPSRSNKPALQCVKLVAKNKVLELTATDMEIAIKWPVTQVDIASEGECLVYAGKLAEVVRLISDDVFTLETEGNNATVRHSSGKFTLYGHPVADFPPVDSIEKPESGASMTTLNLQHGIDRTMHTASRSIDARYAMHGINFEFEKTKLTLMATNGHAMSMVGIDYTGNGVSVVLPIKAVSIISKLNKEADAVSMRTDNFKCGLWFYVGENDATPIHLRCAVLEGTFPPCRDIIPKKYDMEFSVGRERFLTAISQVASLSEAGNIFHNLLVMAVTPKSLSLSGRNPDNGESVADLPIEDFKGEVLPVSVWASLITGHLKAAECVTVKVKATKSIFYISGDHGTDFLTTIKQ